MSPLPLELAVASSRAVKLLKSNRKSNCNQDDAGRPGEPAVQHSVRTRLFQRPSGFKTGDAPNNPFK